MGRFIGKLRYGVLGIPVSATGVITYTNGTNPSAAQTVTVGSQVYTFRASLAAANEILIGANADASFTNLKDAIIRGSGEGSTYGTGTGANVSATAAIDTGTDKVTVTARDTGAMGNTVALATNASGATLSGATLSGGTPIAFLDGKPEGSPNSPVSSYQISPNDVLILASTANGSLPAERSGVAIQDYS